MILMAAHSYRRHKKRKNLPSILLKTKIEVSLADLIVDTKNIKEETISLVERNKIEALTFLINEGELYCDYCDLDYAKIMQYVDKHVDKEEIRAILDNRKSRG